MFIAYSPIILRKVKHVVEIQSIRPDRTISKAISEKRCVIGILNISLKHADAIVGHVHHTSCSRVGAGWHRHCGVAQGCVGCTCREETDIGNLDGQSVARTSRVVELCRVVLGGGDACCVVATKDEASVGVASLGGPIQAPVDRPGSGRDQVLVFERLEESGVATKAKDGLGLVELLSPVTLWDAKGKVLQSGCFAQGPEIRIVYCGRIRTRVGDIGVGRSLACCVGGGEIERTAAPSDAALRRNRLLTCCWSIAQVVAIVDKAIIEPKYTKKKDTKDQYRSCGAVIGKCQEVSREFKNLPIRQHGEILGRSSYTNGYAPDQCIVLRFCN